MKAVSGKRRCRLHGGLSTGPKSLEGKVKSLEALADGRALLAIRRAGATMD